LFFQIYICITLCRKVNIILRYISFSLEPSWLGTPVKHHRCRQQIFCGIKFWFELEHAVGLNMAFLSGEMVW